MTVQASESHRKKPGLVGSLLGGGKAIWALAVGIALVAVFGALSILGDAAATQTYYVLTRDIPARTQITQDMLEPREAKVGQTPPNAFDAATVTALPVFSKIALKAGDVPSTSNAGELTRITDEVPDNFVAASFSAEPELVVAGKVRTGDHIDVIAINDAGPTGDLAKVVLSHVLVLDVTINPNQIAAAANGGQEGQNVGQPGPESEAARSGIPSVYTVALNPKDATKLALLRNFDLFVVLSGDVPDDVEVADVTVDQAFAETPVDSSAGTFDSVFIKRWDVAFEPDNIYVDESGRVWRVNADKVWVSGDTTLDAGDTPPGYLSIPAGTQFFDAEGTYWVTTAPENSRPATTGQTVWTAPEKNQTLAEGDNPVGFDPHAEFEKDAPAVTQ